MNMGRAQTMAPGFAHTLLSARGVKERLAAYGIKPNKALGQNFLIDRAARDMMAQSVPQGMPVYEVGPGLGAFTEALADGGRRVFALEKDAGMARLLKDTLTAEGLEIAHGDALKYPLREVYMRFGQKPFYVAGNLPYYITSNFCMRVLASRLPVKGMTLLLQQEAAARFFAGPGCREYGPLAVLTACAYKAGRLFALGPESFYPGPKVQSAAITLYGDAAHVPPDLPRFLAGAFAMRRKTLCNNLFAMGYGREAVYAALGRTGLKTDIRADAMDAAALITLFETLGGV
ncbi:MAG: 16S rRNA (adenine(1518)-N(6)/adenine(1519)-N(6))-dimethyltransferase RsmA [Clostridiales bacterium]|nr:16S rRNA (adenine(1518)-N(6)/adenine(1519)-N(6))-dimethyltransferase RsmA [Clostridiales bacterium]